MPFSIHVPSVGNVLVSDEGPLNVVQIPAKAFTGNVSGRARLHNGVCPLHGSGNDGPCIKFQHLPGKSRGIVQPGIGRKAVVFYRALFKPVAIFTILLASGFGLKFFLGNVTHGLNFSPTITKAGTSNGRAMVEPNNNNPGSRIRPNDIHPVSNVRTNVPNAVKK